RAFTRTPNTLHSALARYTHQTGGRRRLPATAASPAAAAAAPSWIPPVNGIRYGDRRTSCLSDLAEKPPLAGVSYLVDRRTEKPRISGASLPFECYYAVTGTPTRTTGTATPSKNCATAPP